MLERFRRFLRRNSGMVGASPSTRQVPVSGSDHAEDFAHRWADRLEQYCAIRMSELGLPVDKNGAPDYDGDGKWRAFDPHGRSGGNITSGVYLNSGVLNPDLLEGKKGGDVWPRARLCDRIDAIIAHEWEEDRHGSHEAALMAAPKTDLLISDEARKILQAMGK